MIKKLPELLAPAGSASAFFAALENGADGVYCGLDLFSARTRALNFSLDQMGRLIHFAHTAGKKVYVALNTLIRCRELTEFTDYLLTLEAMGPDGIILQDMGAARLAREYFPALRIHASTQLAVHNLEGTRAAADLGFSRVILARELTLSEITGIVNDSPVEIEVFVHGALCYSYSGLCLFSSMELGAGANRGQCRQPCRRLFECPGKKACFFSTKDLETLDFLDKIVESGVCAIKIEGRMRGPEYVARVTEYYRKALDNYAQEKSVVSGNRAVPQERSTTSGFIGGADFRDILAPDKQAMAGKLAGRVQKKSETFILIRAETDLHLGDRLRIYNKKTDSSRGFTLTEMTLNRRRISRTRSSGEVNIRCPHAAAAGDLVFLVNRAEANVLSNEKAIKKLAACKTSLNSVVLCINFAEQGRIDFLARGRGWSVRTSLECAFRKSRGEGLNRSILERHFLNKMPNGFRIVSIETESIPEGVYISPTLFKKALKKIGEECARACSAHEEHPRRIIRELLFKKTLRDKFHTAPRAVKSYKQIIYTDSPGRTREVSHGGLCWLQMNTDIWKDLLGGSLNPDTIICLEPVSHDSEWRAMAGNIEMLLNRGHKKFGVSNIAHFRLFKNREVILYSDYRLYCSNPLAAAAIMAQGVQYIALNIEDPAENWAILLASSNNNIILPGLLPVPLFYSRLSTGINGLVKDSRNREFAAGRRGNIFVLSAVIDRMKDCGTMEGGPGLYGVLKVG
ncbi:MAG: peptidase U32 family protein [bacterium]